MSAEPGQDDLVLRPATPDDVDEVAALYLATRRDAVPQMPPQVHTLEEVRAHTARTLAEPGHQFWVAERDDALLGWAHVAPGWLDGLYVGPLHQGAGIGSALLDLVKAQLPGGFALSVFASNAPARGFYRRHGLFVLEHTDGSANEEGCPDVRMAWPGRDPLAYLRDQVDAADAELAELLARRFALTAAIQGYKERAGAAGGHAGRDAEREREIVARMARHVPGLPAERIAPIVDAVITEGLTAWEQGRR
jgi:chorismate mutase/ribosomal protein S18 acetylase RimI-like enzyme